MDERANKKTIQVTNSRTGDRVDRWLTDVCPELSRSAIRRLIDSGDVLVDSKTVKANYRLNGTEEVSILIPEPEPPDLQAEDVDLDIRYEDEWLIVVNKPTGMTVHPAGSFRTGTLVNALLGHAELSSINGDLRPGIVHRLDKDTSGLLVVAKDDATHRHLSAQLEAREVKRTYVALCWGIPDEDEDTIETMIDRSRRDRTKMTVANAGRVAITHYRVAARYDFTAKLEVSLETGRTHQIRVHLDHIGHPVFGDPTYNGDEKRLKGISPLYRTEAAKLLRRIDRQMLHAGELAFTHPNTGEDVSLQADLPEDMASVIGELERN